MTAKEKRICKSFARKTGLPCRMEAVEGSDYCKFHGGGSVGKKTGKGSPKGAPKVPGSGGPPPLGSANAMTHGANTAKMPAEMQALADSIFIEYTEGTEDISKIDMRAFKRVAELEAKFSFAVANEEIPAVALDIIHRTLHRELKALKATREMRETSSTGTSPAEVIAAIMIKVEERRAQIRSRPTQVIDVPGSPVDTE